MECWLIDAYRSNNEIVLWLKAGARNIRHTVRYTHTIYLENSSLARLFLQENKIPYITLQKRTYLQTWKTVHAVKVPCVGRFESFVRFIEEKTKHRVALYNADVVPELMYLYEHNLKPCSKVNFTLDKITLLDDNCIISLKVAMLDVIFDGDAVKKIIFNDVAFVGDERDLLYNFVQAFHAQDPDVIFAHCAFACLPKLEQRCKFHNIVCNFHRWDQTALRYRGGKTFFSYGTVRYQDYAVRLHGRLLIDASTVVGNDCKIDALVELSQLCGVGLQHVASRSYGAVFQAALVRTLVRDGVLVPFKEKPLDVPLTMEELIKSDRVGHTYDPCVGFHKNVIEFDFCSMYPWLMYNHNISAETILRDRGIKEQAPGIPVQICAEKKGYVSEAIKPFIDRRMYYKEHPNAVHKQRAIGLKWVLVSSYGYLRFREFKLGIPTSHMAIGAFSREALLSAGKFAERKGFRIVHGIIDALYLHKEHATQQEILALRENIERQIGIPLSFEGIFKWIVFLPSINNSDRPIPARYYGVFIDGKIKARGIEIRQRNVPKIVKNFQKEVLHLLSLCDTQEEIVQLIPTLCKALREQVRQLPYVDCTLLVCRVKIGHDVYKNNIPQKQILEQLKKSGVAVMPGQAVYFIMTPSGAVLPQLYDGNVDVKHYTKLLVRSLFILMQPFGLTKDKIYSYLCDDRQATLDEYGHIFMHTPLIFRANTIHNEFLVKKR